MKGCDNHRRNTVMRNVPSLKKKLPENASKKRQVTVAKKIAIRREILDRLGLRRNSIVKDVRYC